MALARSLAVVLGIPLALLGAALLTGHVALWVALVLVEALIFRAQASFALGSGAVFFNRRGIALLEKGDAASAAEAFARALRLGRGQSAYVNNLGLALVYTGDLDRAREVMEPVVARTNLPPEMRGILMSTWAMLLALLGELDAARTAEAEGFHESFSVAAWIIAARERRWPFTRPAEIKGAWTRHLYDVLEAYVAGEGYRDRVLERPLPIGLARALAHRWPEMKAFLGS